jgi:hypothetical protein
MQAWIDFFTTDYGLMSLAVIAFIIGMGAYIGWFVNKHVKEDTARHDKLLLERKASSQG